MEESISFNLQLKNTKDNLIYYCEDYGIEFRVSWNKAKLASLLEEKLLKAPEILTRFLALDHFVAIKNMITNGGSMEVNNLIPYISLITRGLAKETFLPEAKARITLIKEFMEVIAPKIDDILADETLLKQDKLDRLICGIIKIYGILPEIEIFKLLSNFTGRNFSTKDFTEMLLVRDRLLKEVRIHIYKQKFYYHSEMMEEPDNILTEIISRKNLSYVKFTEEELLVFGSLHYVPDDSRSQALFSEMEKRGVVSAADFIRWGWFKVQNDKNPGEIMKFFSGSIRFSDLEDMNHFSRFVMDFINAQPRWKLKGHSPEELFQDEKKHLRPLPTEPFVARREQPSKSVFREQGRNELCRCGSGKKFKNCCGSPLRSISLN